MLHCITHWIFQKKTENCDLYSYHFFIQEKVLANAMCNVYIEKWTLAVRTSYVARSFMRMWILGQKIKFQKMAEKNAKNRLRQLKLKTIKNSKICQNFPPACRTKMGLICNQVPALSQLHGAVLFVFLHFVDSFSRFS